MPNITVEREPERQDKRRLWIAATIAGVVLIVTAVLCCLPARDPYAGLPPEERLIRHTVNAFDPAQSTLQRVDSVWRALKSSAKIPQARRQAAIVEATVAGVNRNLEAFRALPPERKRERAEQFYRDALQTRDYFRKLPEAKRRRAKDLLYSDPGGKAELDRAMNTILNGLSPEERQMLSPVFTVWKTTLEEK